MNGLPTDFSAAHAAAVLHDFSTASPLVHCLTNDVVQSFTDNVLLAPGASPAMVMDPGEAAQLVDALLINVGTLASTRDAAQANGSGSFTPAFLDALALLRQEAQTCTL